MSPVSIDDPRSWVPGGNEAISRATCKEPTGPVETANSPVVALEVVDILLFIDVIYLDLSVAVPEGNFVIVAEGDGADVVVDLVGLVDAADVGGAARPLSLIHI